MDNMDKYNIEQALTKAYSPPDWGQWGFLAKVNYCANHSEYPLWYGEIQTLPATGFMVND